MGGGHTPEPTRESLYEPLKRSEVTDTFLYKMFDIPTDWFKRNITDRFRKKYPYYHRRYPRVPSIDQCYTDDFICFWEADQQYKRDKLVDVEIVHILRRRRDQCNVWYGRQPDLLEKHCTQILEDYETASTNYFIKYGDLGTAATVTNALMKQKHRMLWEMKHGEVGSKGDPDAWPNFLAKPKGYNQPKETLVENLRDFKSYQNSPKEMAP